MFGEGISKMGELVDYGVSFDRDGMIKMYQDGLLLDSANISNIGDECSDCPQRQNDRDRRRRIRGYSS